MKKQLIILIAILMFTACGDKTDADGTFMQQGYEEVTECIVQGGNIEEYLIENLSTGKQYIMQQCNFDGCVKAQCKPGAPFCPWICE